MNIVTNVLNQKKIILVELVSKEFNHLAAILHVYAGGLNFMKKKKSVIIFQKENGNTFTLLIIFLVKSLQNLQSPQSDSTPWDTNSRVDNI